jgi:precorrin-6B C5,15-methyltransferase / cobalt-precorrin-6B C5,C15-methyltransferase
LNPWLWVIGIGDDGIEGLSPAVRQILAGAEVIAGGHRHLKMVPSDDRPRIAWTIPFSAGLDAIWQLRGQSVAVLASGDPLCYGVGLSLRDRLLAGGANPIQEMAIFPAPGAFSLAWSRLQWNPAEVETVSCCGRSPETLRAMLYPGAKILALSGDGETPGQVAKILQEQGAGEAIVTVLEHLGGVTERVFSFKAVDWQPQSFAKLNTIAIQCPGNLRSHSRLPGLPDDAYVHDGQITKQQVRACTLAALAPRPGELLWDVGAGSGSISIEWLRSHPRNRAIAIEQHPQRGLNIALNAAQLGVPHLQLKSGAAPAVLQDLPSPHAIFIGGGLTGSDVFESCWQALRPGGRLVANGVTVETELRIFQLQSQYGGSLSRIAIQQAAPIGKFLGWKALAPVTQWWVQKGW